MGLFDRHKRHMRVFNPNRSGGNALTASGLKIKQRDADTMRRLIQPWQSRAFAYYDIVPEIKYAAQFYSRALSVLRLYPATMDEAGDFVETTQPDAVTQLERIQDPGGGRSSLLASYGRLMFLSGECYLFVTYDDETQREQWEMLSTDELRVTGSGFVRYKAPSMQAMNFGVPDDDNYEPVDDTSAVAYRLWKRHPRYSMLADSTMQGVLDICEELVLLTQTVRSRARSRMAQGGILLLNGKISPPPLEPVPDEDMEEDPFARDLTDALTAPITNEGAASAVVPLVVRVELDKDEGGLDNAMKHLQIVDPTQIYPETGLRNECIKRLAIGLDLPPEILLGLEDSNHWTAWSIDEQTWKAHLQPVAQQLVDDLTSSFFQPTLREAGVSNWQDFYIAYDATAIINHPDRTTDAKDLFDRGELSGEALRRAAGFDEDDAPDEEEVWRYIGVKVRDGSLALYGIPSVKAGGIEPTPGELVSGQGGVESAPVSQAGQQSAVDKGPPANDPTATVGSANVERIMAAADLAVYRCRELAGTRLRNYAKRDQTVLALLGSNGHTASHQIAAILGRDAAKQVNAPSERELVLGATLILQDTLRMWGIRDQAILIPLAERVEQHAARTLYDEHPGPLPSSFRNYIIGFLGASNAQAAK